MLMSGAVKLLSGDAVWSSFSALKFHYQTQPLPTPIAWYMHQLPGWFQEASVVVMFAIELGAPLLIFAPRRVRFLAGIAIVFLQVLILLTGNYTYFNLLTIALCIPLLDDRALARITRSTAVSPVGFFCRRTTSLVAIVLVLLSSSALVAQFFPETRPLRYVERMLSPLNLTNTYGLFAVMTTVRHEIVVEGSNDGIILERVRVQIQAGRYSSGASLGRAAATASRLADVVRGFGELSKQSVVREFCVSGCSKDRLMWFRCSGAIRLRGLHHDLFGLWCMTTPSPIGRLGVGRAPGGIGR